jgi:diacylglycerol kinase family enzyme
MEAGPLFIFSGAGAMRHNFLIIHNKMAGRRNSPLLAAVAGELERAGAGFALKAAGSLEEDMELAREAARNGGFDAVVAAGGDSTVRGVAMGLAGSDMPLGVIPAGTGNVLAEEIGLSRDPSRIAATLIEGEEKKINMGLADGEPFLLMTGVGFDAEVVQKLNHDLKQRVRKAAYVWPTLKALAKKPPSLSVSFDEEKNEGEGRSGRAYGAAFVVVTRARHYGGSFIIAPKADMGGDDLQVVMFTKKGRMGMIVSLLGMAMGWNGRLAKKALDEKGEFVGHVMKTPGVMIRPARHVRIECLPSCSAPAQIDGEYMGETPLEIRADGGSVILLSPPSNID